MAEQCWIPGCWIPLLHTWQSYGQGLEQPWGGANSWQAGSRERWGFRLIIPDSLGTRVLGAQVELPPEQAAPL